MNAHTPGPWAQYEGDPLIIVDSYGASLGEMSAGSPNVSRSEQIANARLIAAAPELLKALQLAVRQNSHDMRMTGEELRQCEAAIAKATREQP